MAPRILPSSRRFLSLWLTHWATDCRTRRKTTTAGAVRWGPETPLVLAERGDNHWLIAAANPAAEALGIRPGQGLADARACLPALVAEPMDRAADEADLRRLADWATRFSPAVAIEGEDGLTLDITGCAHLWPGEAGLLADLKARLARFKLHGRSAVADTIGAAWALARYGPPDAIQKTSQPAEALADLPPAALRLPEPLAAQLERLGLRRIADLAVLPRAALASRFGEAMVQRLDQALARAPETLSPLLPQPPRHVRLDLAEPIIDQPSILRALDLPLARLIELLTPGQAGIRRLELACYLLDGSVRRLVVGTVGPSLDAAHLRTLVSDRIGELDPGEGVEALRVSALAIEPIQAHQRRFDEDAHDPASLPPLIDRLRNRLGQSALTRPMPRASHVPERATASLPPLARAARCHWPKTAGRPLRLLAHPEPISALAPVPDDPPVQFRWRRVLHRVRAAEGPERIAPEWWLAEDDGREIRDYYRVENMEGRRFWLYRAGLYRVGEAPRWFMHGLFG